MVAPVPSFSAPARHWADPVTLNGARQILPHGLVFSPNRPCISDGFYPPWAGGFPFGRPHDPELRSGGGGARPPLRKEHFLMARLSNDPGGRRRILFFVKQGPRQA